MHSVVLHFRHVLGRLAEDLDEDKRQKKTIGMEQDSEKMKGVKGRDVKESKN